MDSIINKIRRQYAEMGPAEKRIADYILGHTDELLSMSVSELAEHCGCGNATVVRFSRRLHFEGFGMLKIGLAGELRESSAISAEIKKGDSAFEIYEKIIEEVPATLAATKTVLDPAAIGAAAEAIMGADRIVVFGLGNSAAIAQDAAHKLLRLGLPAQPCCDNHMQAIVASHLKRGQVAVGISHSGASRDVVEALELARACGATTVCVTNYGNPPIVEASDIRLFTRSEETKHSILALRSRFAQLAIFDSIYTYIVLNADQKSRREIFNTEFALQNKKM